ncbi:MAG: redoxin family protein [Solirubrobacterales bacterium]
MRARPAGNRGPGDAMPELRLRDTSGDAHILGNDGEHATLVVWTCNHCPYALAWHDRLAAVADEYRDRGVRTLMVNSNDAERYPADSLEQMRDRVEREGWTVPYLHDPDQQAAQAWAAQVTPHVYVLGSGGELAYEGAPDDDHADPDAGARWVRDALDAVLGGQAPDPALTEPVGCSVKWKP